MYDVTINHYSLYDIRLLNKFPLMILISVLCSIAKSVINLREN